MCSWKQEFCTKVIVRSGSQKYVTIILPAEAGRKTYEVGEVPRCRRCVAVGILDPGAKRWTYVSSTVIKRPRKLFEQVTFSSFCSSVKRWYRGWYLLNSQSLIKNAFCLRTSSAIFKLLRLVLYYLIWLRTFPRALIIPFTFLKFDTTIINYICKYNLINKFTAPQPRYTTV